MIPFRTGNLGVERLAAAREGRPPPDPEDERRLLPAWRAAGFDAVEDYVFWELVEPVRGRPDWSAQRGNAAAAKAAGLAWWIYPWAHAVPEWFRASRGFVPGRCLEHGAPGPMMSPFAASTRDASRGFLRAARRGLGDLVDGVAVAFPADYGEAGFLSGVAGWLLGEGSHHHTGLWCGEREARLAFARQARDRHDTPGRLGRAWALDPQDAWERCPYPYGGDEAPDEPTLAHRLDFARFYQGAITDLARALLEEAREQFPDVPRELKIGHCSETLELGTDWHALVAAAAATETTVRFTGAGMGEVFTRRLASLCRGHGVRFATEAPREVDRRHLVERLYTDLAAGTTSFFEYPEQLEAVREPLAALRPALGREPVLPAVAVAYPTVELRLAPGHGAPTDTVHCWDALRRVCDLHPLDERQIARGALREHTALVWLEDAHVPGETLAAIDAWVRAGGTLITGCGRGPVPLEDGDGTGAVAELLAAMRATAVHYRPGRTAGSHASVVHFGEIGSRLLLSGDWHGRDDGAWAWPTAATDSADVGLGESASVPCRWTGSRAAVHVPYPSAGPEASRAHAVDLLLDAWAPEDRGALAVRVRVDGESAGTLTVRGTSRSQLPLPDRSAGRGERDAIARVELELPVRRPRAQGAQADRRELGLLVRRMAIVARGASASGGIDRVPAGGEPPDLVATGDVRAFGTGSVMPGDGTPLSALARLRAWLDARDGAPRDVSLRCLVTSIEGGLLVHNPEPRTAALPELHPSDDILNARGLTVPPLGTLWLCRRSAPPLDTTLSGSSDGA